LASWFLASSRHSELTAGWWRKVKDYWYQQRGKIHSETVKNSYLCDQSWFVAPNGGARLSYYPYFWSHHLFNRMLQTDAVADGLWRSVERPKASDGLCWLQRLQDEDHTLSPQQTLEFMQSSVDRSVMQKLNQRQDYPEDVYRWLKQLPLSR